MTAWLAALERYCACPTPCRLWALIVATQEVDQ